MKNLVYLMLTVFFIAAVGLTACGGNEPERQSQVVESSAGQAGEAADATSAGDPAAGREKFVSACAACHGPAGEGIEGLGKDMTTSPFIAAQSDRELIEFLKVGRDPGDPLNTTGVVMPPKGGNPRLDEQDLQDIVAYIRQIHQ